MTVKIHRNAATLRKRALASIAKIRDRAYDEIKDAAHSDRSYETALFKHLFDNFDDMHKGVVAMIIDTNAKLQRCGTEFERSQPTYAQFKDAKRNSGKNAQKHH